MEKGGRQLFIFPEESGNNTDVNNKVVPLMTDIESA